MAETEQGRGEAAIVLKKYGNRRIYDTTSSRYVTLGEVEAMVQGGKDIVVKDAKSGEDITKEILVQLLLERDGARAALPMGLLKQAVRLANSPLKEGLVKSLQEGLDSFMQSQRAVLDAQRAFSSQMEKLNPWLQPGATPVPLWNPFAPPAPGGPPMSPSPGVASSSPPPSPPSPTGGDVDTLRVELAQTQALVKQLLERELARDRLPEPSPSSKKTAAPKKAPPKKAPAKKAPPASTRRA